MKESELQTKIKDKLTKSGWLVVKLEKTSWNGIPDLMCIRKGNVIFLEVKTEIGIVAPLQEHRIEVLNAYGCFARVVRSLDDVDIFCYKNL